MKGSILMKNNNIKRADNWLACQFLIQDLIENEHFSPSVINVYVDEIVRLLKETSERQA